MHNDRNLRLRRNFVLLLVALSFSFGNSASADIAPPLQGTTKAAARSAAVPPTKSGPANLKGSQGDSKKGFDLNALKKKLNGLVKRWNLPGIGVVVVNRERVLFAGGFGFANKEKRTPITQDTQFRIGAVSMSFVALAVLKLVEEGKLQLRDKVKDLVPNVSFTNPYAKTHPLRLVHLLEHTSGFEDWHHNELYHRKMDLQPLSVSLSINPRSRRVRWKPGTHVSFSRPGYTVAGAIVEKVSGKPLQVYIKETILKPMGIAVGDFYRTALIKKHLAQGYKGVPIYNSNKASGGKGEKQSKPKTLQKPKKDDFFTPMALKVSRQEYLNLYHWPAQSLHLSPLEMGRFLQFLLRRGRPVIRGRRLLKRASILRMETPVTALHVRKGLKVGYGLANDSSYEHGYPSHGHTGRVPGFLTTARYLPKQGVGFAVMLPTSGSRKPLKEAQRAIAKALLAHLPRPRPSTFKRTRAQLQAFAGEYQISALRKQILAILRDFFWVRIRAEKDHLTMQYCNLLFSMKKKILYPTSPNTFRFKKNLGPSVGFGKNKQGQMLMFEQGFNGTLLRNEGFPPKLYSNLFLLCLLIGGVTVLFTLIWVPIKLFGGLRESNYLRLRVTPFLSLLSLVGAFFALVGRSEEQLGNQNTYTMSFFVLTLLFATFTVYSVVLLIRSFHVDGIHPAVRLWATAAVSANVGLMIYLWPILGLRFWSY